MNPSRSTLACRLPRAAAGLFGASLAAAVFAADPAADPAADQVVEVLAAGRGGGQLSSVATGLELSSRQTPQSVSMVTRGQMDDFRLDTVNRVLSVVPGVTVESVETDRTYYTARGFDITNFQVDGLGMPFTNGGQWGDLDTALFERIDILRGANGLQSSTGNPSATIDFVRKRPTARWQARASSSVSSWNGARVEGALSGPLTDEGNLRARLIAVGDRSESYLARYRRRRTVFSGQVDLDIARDTRLSLGLAAQRNDADGVMWGALPLNFSDGSPTRYRVGTSSAADWTYWDNADRRAIAELTRDFGGGWTAKASWVSREQASGAALFYVSGLPDPVSGLGLAGYASRFDGRYGQRMADLRVSGAFELGGRRQDLVFGFGQARERVREHSRGPGTAGDPVPDLASWDGHRAQPAWDPVGTSGSEVDTDRRSVFAAAHLHATGELAFVVGANATVLRSRGQEYGAAHDTDRRALTPYVGAVWDIGPGLSAYASFTRIFNPQVEADADHRVLGPIRGSTAEAGLKGEWLDKRLSGSAAVFRARQAGTATFAGTYAATDARAGQSYYTAQDDTSTGLELEISGRVAPGWEVHGGYARLALDNDADGSPARTFVARRTLRLAATWSPAPLPGFKTGAALKWQSAIESTDPSTGFVARQGGYALLDWMAGYDVDLHWNVGLHVDNVTNRRHLASLYWNQGFYGEPRKVSASARYTF